MLSACCTGIGHSQVEKFLAGLNIRFMDDKTFTKNQQNMLGIVERTAKRVMKEGAMEIKADAIESKHVTKDGIGLVTVTADGFWCKRSYGKKYDSLSGVTVIVSLITNKVLYYKVRNKYCVINVRAKNLKRAARKHDCNQDYDPNAPSTAMESDIILEGSRRSVEDHGLIYNKLVADGDSSIPKVIADRKVYDDYNIETELERCKNHLFPGLTTKLYEIANTTQPRGTQQVAGFVELRNIIKKNISKLRIAINFAIDVRKNQNISSFEKITSLETDIQDIPSHIFGEHANCKSNPYICEEKTIGSETNIVGELTNIGLLVELKMLCFQLVNTVRVCFKK